MSRSRSPSWRHPYRGFALAEQGSTRNLARRALVALAGTSVFLNVVAERYIERAEEAPLTAFAAAFLIAAFLWDMFSSREMVATDGRRLPRLARALLHFSVGDASERGRSTVLLPIDDH